MLIQIQIRLVFLTPFKSKKKSKNPETIDKTEKSLEDNKNTIVVNQVTPYTRKDYYVNRASSFSTTCQFCQQKIMTKSIQTFNCGTCLFVVVQEW